MYLVSLKQTNKAGNTVFSAQAKFNLIEGEEFEGFGREVANFCYETKKFINRSLKRGVKVQGFRKTLPMTISVVSLDENDDLAASVEFKNFGRFIEETTEAKLRAQLKDSAEFTYKFSNWNK